MTSSRTWLIGALAIAGVVAAAAAGLPAPASMAAPPRDDSTNEPVFLVHGYSGHAAVDCQRRWGSAAAAWRWHGPVHMVGYYRGDAESCSTRIANADTSTSLRDIGAQLAWDIYVRYARKGQSVDIVGHSMGGLIARVAVWGTQLKRPGFPPFIYVEDAVTLGTPHAGVTAGWVQGCRATQCVQMRPGSAFLRTLAATGRNPQSAQGTDWTLIGSESDATVHWRSANAGAGSRTMNPGHNVLYKRAERIGHGALASAIDRDRRRRLSYANKGGRFDTSDEPRNVRQSRRGRAPVYAARNAITFWADW